MKKIIILAVIAFANCDLYSKFEINTVQRALCLDETELAISLIKSGHDFYENINSGMNPMDYAMGRGNIEMAMAMIDRGFDVKNNFHGNIGSNSLNRRITNLWYAAICNQNQEKMVNFCIELGLDPNQIIYNSGFRGCTWTPLLLAVEYSAPTKVIKMLLDAGAEINKSAVPYIYGTFERYTPLSLAAKLGRKEVFYFLLSQGAE